MGLLLRRALLAASQTGGGEDAPEFPLYLYFDYCEESFFLKTCERAADETSILLFEYLKKTIEQYGTNLFIDEAVLKSLGIDIYIEGGYVNRVDLDILVGDLGLQTNGEYTLVILRDSGELFYEQ